MAWQLQVLADFALAMLLGGIIGFDRELADRPAGLRTHMMIAGASALLVALGGLLLDANARMFSSAGDPTRIIHAIVTGVSFLGAGTIFRSSEPGSAVEGLTTAATVLVTAAIGIAVALHQHAIATGAAVLVVLVLRVFRWLERRLKPSP